MRLSVIIPSRDERHRLPDVVAGLEAQTLLPDEVVIADGMSTDGSRELLAELAATRPWLTVVDNPQRIVPTGLNAAVAAASGDVVARMDTHAAYPPDYLEQVVTLLDAHPEVGGVGSLMSTEGRTPWGRAIAATLRRPFGLGGARHRVGGEAGPIPHVFSGCYRREVLDAAGGWDERLQTNEDFEHDVRVWQTGAVLWLAPEATTTWYVRESLPRLAKQMWRYGFYKGLTLHLHPDSLQTRQLAPPAVVAGLAGLLVLRPRLGAVAAVAYLGASGMLGARAAAQDGADAWRGALVPPVVHLSWGSGLLAGFTRFAGSRGTARPVRPRQETA